MGLVLVDLDDSVGIITLNNKEKHNALSRAMIDEFVEGFNGLAANRARAVIIRALPGAKVWCSGMDISELPGPGDDPVAYRETQQGLIRTIQNFTAPVIAMIEGSVWGAGCELVSVCDLLIGTDSSTFSVTPAKIGAPYHPAGILNLIRLAGLPVVREMLFTARPIKARRALEAGILNHLTPASELESFTYDIARQICRNSPLSIAVIKEQLRLLTGTAPLSPEVSERIRVLQRMVWDSQDYLEGQRAFLEKRPPVFRGK
jgi:methylmalonyl-CoA decarboxylase